MCLRRANTPLPKISYLYFSVLGLTKSMYMIASTIFDEFTEFIAGLQPSEVVAFRPSAQASARYEWLVEQEKARSLTAEERSELENFEVLEHIMRRAKAKARIKLAG
jgi:hypothetical protein